MWRRCNVDGSAMSPFCIYIVSCAESVWSRAKCCVCIRNGEGMNIAQETFNVVDYQELEELIREEFKQPDFNIVLSEGWRNDSSYEIIVTPGYFPPNAEEVAKFRAKAIDRDENLFILDDLMADMAQRGVIPEGVYLIRVMW